MRSDHTFLDAVECFHTPGTSRGTLAWCCPALSNCSVMYSRLLVIEICNRKRDKEHKRGGLRRKVTLVRIK